MRKLIKGRVKVIYPKYFKNSDEPYSLVFWADLAILIKYPTFSGVFKRFHGKTNTKLNYQYLYTILICNKKRKMYILTLNVLFGGQNRLRPIHSMYWTGYIVSVFSTWDV